MCCFSRREYFFRCYSFIIFVNGMNRFIHFITDPAGVFFCGGGYEEWITVEFLLDLVGVKNAGG